MADMSQVCKIAMLSFQQTNTRKIIVLGRKIVHFSPTYGLTNANKKKHTQKMLLTRVLICNTRIQCRIGLLRKPQCIWDVCQVQSCWLLRHLASVQNKSLIQTNGWLAGCLCGQLGGWVQGLLGSFAWLALCLDGLLAWQAFWMAGWLARHLHKYMSSCWKEVWLTWVRFAR